MARPAKPLDQQHINRIAVYLTDEDDQLIRSIAAKKGIPAAVLARTFIISKLDAITFNTSKHREQFKQELSWLEGFNNDK